MEKRSYLLHALSPLHAGTGQAADVIDLPIARMKGTGIPIVPGSSVKGVLRDWFDGGRLAEGPHRAVFGPATHEDPATHAGALMVHDARLLALPVRSFRGTFAWVSSPLLLELARRDLGDATLPLVKILDERCVVLPAGNDLAPSLCVDSEIANGYPDVLKDPARAKAAKAYLDDLDLPVKDREKLSTAVGQWAKYIGERVYPEDSATFTRRFLLVDDETMTFFWETGTQVDTRVRLNSETRTVAKGALWAEESLPPETLLLGLASADKSRRDGQDLKPADVLNAALGAEHTLQFGGKATVGRGLCRLIPVVAGGA